jgi:hypothetical protein
MTLGWGFIGKRINGKIIYSDYNWTFVMEFEPGNINHYRKQINKQWFKNDIPNKNFAWRRANTLREYLKDPADYYLLLKGNSILLWDWRKKKFVSMADHLKELGIVRTWDKK